MDYEKMLFLMYVMVKNLNKKLAEVFSKEGSSKEERGDVYAEWKTGLFGLLSVDKLMREKGYLEKDEGVNYYPGDEEMASFICSLNVIDKLDKDLGEEERFIAGFNHVMNLIMNLGIIGDDIKEEYGMDENSALVSGCLLMYRIARYGMNKGYIRKEAMELFTEEELEEIWNDLIDEKGGK